MSIRDQGRDTHDPIHDPIDNTGLVVLPQTFLERLAEAPEPHRRSLELQRKVGLDELIFLSSSYAIGGIFPQQGAL